MDISVIICTYNRAESLVKTLDSLEQLSVPPDLSWELIIVNNNSSDGTKTVVEEFQQRNKLPIRYLFQAKQGKSHAQNLGVQSSKGEIVAITDDDCIVHNGWLSSIWKAFASYPCAVVGGRILPTWSVQKPDWFDADGPFKLGGPIVSFDHGNENKIITTSPFGANLSFRRAVFDKYGYFKTDLGPNASGVIRLGGGGEDTEFCRRLLSSGEKIVYCAEALVYHPVEKERISKRYFCFWYFNYGKVLIKTSSTPEDVRSYWGVPRYLAGMLVRRASKWLFSFNARKRFYYRAQTYQIAGEIVQAFRQARTRVENHGGD
jgi:glycosyltransferase involved in cell wall biosynthesis